MGGNQEREANAAGGRGFELVERRCRLCRGALVGGLTALVAALPPAAADPVGPSLVEVAGVAALATDPSGLSVDPSIVVALPRSVSLAASFGFAAGDVRIDPRPAEADVAAVINGDAAPPGGWASDFNRPLPTAGLPIRSAAPLDPTHTLVLGLSDRTFHDSIGFGLFVACPLHSMQRAEVQFADERAQYFDNRLHWTFSERAAERIQTALAVAWAPVRLLRIGVGAWLEQQVQSEVWIFLPNLVEPSTTLQTLRTRVVPRLTPMASVSVGPWGGWRALVTGQLARSAPLVSEGHVTTRSDEVGGSQKLRMEIGYVPLQAGLWLSWTAREDRLAAGGGLLWRRSSAFSAPSFGVGRLVDTLELRMAARLRIQPRWSVALGGAYRQSPVPEQRGRSNLLDNDTASATVGLAYRPPFFGHGVDVRVGFRLSRLLPRRHEKDVRQMLDEFPDSFDVNGELVDESQGLQTNNPGYPGYSSEGWTGAMVLGLGLKW